MKTLTLIFILCFCAFVLAQGQAPKTLLDQEVVVVRSDFKDFHFRVPEDLQGEWMIRGMYQTQRRL